VTRDIVSLSGSESQLPSHEIVELSAKPSARGEAFESRAV
jgi:hypothetical protein